MGGGRKTVNTSTVGWVYIMRTGSALFKGFARPWHRCQAASVVASTMDYSFVATYPEIIVSMIRYSLCRGRGETEATSEP